MNSIRQVGGHFNRIKVLQDGAPVFCLSLGDFRRAFLLQRPVIHPLYAPSGLPLTEQGAHNSPHHRGVWVGHARVNRVNFFHEGPETGWIVPMDVDIADGPNDARIALKNEWRDPRGTVVARESRVLEVSAIDDGYLLTIVSHLVSADGPLTLEPDMHAYMGVRMIDALDEDDGGRILTSEGTVGEKAVSWEHSKRRVRWVDYTGFMAGRTAGISILAHPGQSPMAVYARSYGSLFLNPTADEPMEIPAGEPFKFGAAFYAHDGPASPETLDALWRNFGRVPL
jgi:hypothetical protein